MLEFDCTAKMNLGLGIPRPEILSVRKHVMKNIKRLIQIMPKGSVKILKWYIKLKI